MTDPIIESGTPENKQSRPPFLVRRRTVFTWLAPLLLFAASMYFRRSEGGFGAFSAGFGLLVAGEAVRFWAAGYIAKDADIATGGPYAFVRNPLYFGSLLLAVGYGLMSGLGVAAVTAMLVVFVAFHMAAILYEESFLKGKFGQPYLDYIAQVPRLIPSIVPKTSGKGSYSWSQAIYNREHISAAFALGFAALLSLRFLWLKG